MYASPIVLIFSRPNSSTRASRRVKTPLSMATISSGLR